MNLIRMCIFSLVVVYKNMYFGRDKFALKLLCGTGLFIVIYSIFNAITIHGLHSPVPYMVGLLAFFLCGLGFPSVVYIIDYKRNPRRIAALMKSL